MSNPHDAYFRRVLGQPRNAAAELRAVLPRELTARLDLDGLVPVPGTFVDAALQSQHTDVLFRTRLDGQQALVYVLIEHQSRSDPLMAFRMLRYLVGIWTQHLKQHPTATRLPAILPLVVHHHRDHTSWSAPTELHDLIDLDPATADVAAPFLPRFRYLLDDLTQVDVQALQARSMPPTARLQLILLKIASGNPHLDTDLKPLLTVLNAIESDPHGTEEMVAIITYIQTVSDTPQQDLHRFFTRLGPHAEEAYMTTAETLRAEGRAEGEVRGQARVLLKLLTIKFGQPTQATIDTVHNATPEQLDTWTARILTANTLDDVLR